MGKTITSNNSSGQLRIFKCKSCGKDATENIYKWRKKPQVKKNICFECIDRKRLLAQDARERAHDMGYGGLSMRGWLL